MLASTLDSLNQELKNTKKPHSKVHKNYKFEGSLKLDNRTTTFRLRNLPEGNVDTNLLREHFKQFGSVVDVIIEDKSSALIKMDTRQNAENAIRKGLFFFLTL
eukprot:TRINITY_DN463_c1_g1_i3.p1 TRINITY_DN463_c1_g1~~TRINITY_DN463_c1_g1_i3.p1  ORF type:complete len:103 (-),score=4.04 TRINITY_DN463_c1_g1_i3:439-747(-)